MSNNKKLALGIVLIIFSMICLTFAAVPLYSIFCKATGFGGTTQIAKKGADKKGERIIKIMFDSNIEPGMMWEFKPVQSEIKVKPGENALVFYYAKNLTNEPIIGTAVYNVTPNKTGIYFNKIQCFCFEEQLLAANEKVMMPVSFFIDPEIENDPNAKDVDTITLSYTFFRVKKNP